MPLRVITTTKHEYHIFALENDLWGLRLQLNIRQQRFDKSQKVLI